MGKLHYSLLNVSPYTSPWINFTNQWATHQSDQYRFSPHNVTANGSASLLNAVTFCLLEPSRSATSIVSEAWSTQYSLLSESNQMIHIYDLLVYIIYYNEVWLNTCVHVSCSVLEFAPSSFYVPVINLGSIVTEECRAFSINMCLFQNFKTIGTIVDPHSYMMCLWGWFLNYVEQCRNILKFLKLWLL